MTAVVALVVLVAALPAAARWLRVAQREHYIPVVSRFALRWWLSTSANAALLALAVAGIRELDALQRRALGLA